MATSTAVPTARVWRVWKGSPTGARPRSFWQGAKGSLPVESCSLCRGSDLRESDAHIELSSRFPRTPFGRSWLDRRFVARSNGYIRGSVLLGKEDSKMYWYNPTTRTSQRVQAPSTDEQSIQMLAGTPESAEFIAEYLVELRRSGSPIEQALVLVGHEFRLREPENQLIL